MAYNLLNHIQGKNGSRWIEAAQALSKLESMPEDNSIEILVLHARAFSIHRGPDVEKDF